MIILSVGMAALLVLAFLALGNFGQETLFAASNDAQSTTHIGGNVNNNKTDTGTTVFNSHTVTTRSQNGEPTRVCVEHIANGKTNVENYDPFNPGNANQIVQELISSSDPNPIRVRGNETWQLCGAAAETTTTTTAGTTTTTTAGTTTTVTGEEEKVCVEHWADGELRNIVFLPTNSDVVRDVIAEGGKRIRGNEFWQFCTTTTTTTTTAPTTTTTTAGTTTVTTAGTTTTVATTTETTTEEETTTVAETTTTVVAGTTVVETTEAAAVVTTEAAAAVTPAVEAEATTEAIAAPTTTVAGVQLPRAGGLPFLPGALAGLGALLAFAGAALRRYLS